MLMLGLTVLASDIVCFPELRKGIESLHYEWW